MTGTNPGAEWLKPAQGGIARAGEILRAGGLVALPTETVYGLAARADSADAVAAIYRAKGRPDFNPLIVHVRDLAQAQLYAQCDERAHMLAARFWPGPLTMVLRAQPDSPIAPAVTAGLPTIALRCPAHPLARAVLAAAQVPVAAPSANRSNAISPTMPDHVALSFGQDCPPILDGGACLAGIESTIVALRPDGGWQILRPGPVTQASLAEVLGPQSAPASLAIEAPGQLASHYSPGKPLRRNAEAPLAGEYMIGFGTIRGDCTLSAQGDLAEAAAHLYHCLHLAAASAHARIAVAPVPDGGIGTAINDRLARAAA